MSDLYNHILGLKGSDANPVEGLEAQVSATSNDECGPSLI